MQPFTYIEALAAVLRAPNIDTDQIVPARFLERATKGGLADALFHDLRFDEQRREKAGFVLNRPELRHAQVLIGGDNFGCGSSREEAVYALADYGFRAVIAPSFGDIFYSNSLKNGFLPIAMDAAAVERLSAAVERQPAARVAIDLAAQEVRSPEGQVFRFDIHAFHKQALLNGLDELDSTLALTDRISAFERETESARHWNSGVTTLPAAAAPNHFFTQAGNTP